MNTVVGRFMVHAGPIRGMTEPELGLVLPYTSEQFETDQARDEHDRTIFAELRDQALEHARQITDPDLINWVRFEFVWY